MTRGHRTDAPPGLALRLLIWSLPEEDRESVIGDLVEELERRRGAAARVWWWMQVSLFVLSAVVHRVVLSPESRRVVMPRLITSFQHAWRRLGHDWQYSSAIVAILAVGIGPAAAMLSVVEHVLLRPLDYREPGRLALVRLDLGELRGHPGLSPAEAIDLRRSGLFESVEVQTRLAEVSLTAGDGLVSLTQVAFTTGMLPMLGVQPMLGRTFLESDLPPPSASGPRSGPAPPPPPQPVLLDFAAWQTHFGGDRSVVGRLIQLNGFPAEVFGVLPDGFRLATGRAVPQRIDVYTPFRLRDLRPAWQFPTLARLKPGTTFAEVQAGLDTLATTLTREHPAEYDVRLRFTAAPLLDDMTRTTRPALNAATAAVLLLLVIAFANATALVLARLRMRDPDFAVRSAIGAGPATLVAEVAMESVLLALAGAALGSVLAVVSVAWIREVIPRTVPRWDMIGVGWTLPAYAFVLGLGGLVLSGLVPVWKVARGATWNILRASAAQGGRPERALSRLVLVGAQLALTVVLTFGCIQLLRTAARLQQVELGFDPNVLTVRVPYDFQRYRTRPQRAELYQRIRDRVRQVPGVTDVGIITHLPLSGATMMDGYQADLSKVTSFDQSANYQAVTPGYFAAMRIPILQGRDFSDQEDRSMQPVVIVDETLVRTVFPGERDVIGRPLRLGWGLPTARIVGVVGHVRAIEVGREVRPQIYAPIGILFQQSASVCVRAAGDPLSLAAAVTAAIHEVGPGRAPSNIARLTINVRSATSTVMAVTALVSFLAISAGLLSAAGLYLVIAFLVHEQRRGTAIRRALGASPAQVIWANIRPTGLVLLLALPAGVLLSAAAAALLGDLVYGVVARDRASLASAAAVAGLVGLVAIWLPLRRATRANIVGVLREG